MYLKKKRNVQRFLFSQYMLNYLKTLESWIPPTVWGKSSLVKLCWTFLQDLHHSKAVIQYEPQLIALSVIYYGLQVCGIMIPCTSEQDQTTWHEVFPITEMNHFFNLLSLSNFTSGLL